MNLDDVWKDLERPAAHLSAGVVRRRVFPEAACDLFLGVRRPSGERLLLLIAHSVVQAEIRLPESRAIETTVVDADGLQTAYALQVVLLDERLADVFSTLAQDVASAAAAAPSTEEAITAFIGRLWRWQRLMERVQPEGLSGSEQQGLFGELWFLRELLLPSLSSAAAIAAWRGPEAAQQDFQFSTLAIEVKTTGAVLPLRMAISSEQQLDAQPGVDLLLAHLSVERVVAGESLPVLVGSIRTRLAEQPDAMALFEERLLDARYLDSQAQRYMGTRFLVRDRHIFHVEGTFPRIVRAELHPGVGEVRYSIGVSDCLGFEVSVRDFQTRLEELQR